MMSSPSQNNQPPRSDGIVRTMFALGVTSTSISACASPKGRVSVPKGRVQGARPSDRYKALDKTKVHRRTGASFVRPPRLAPAHASTDDEDTIEDNISAAEAARRAQQAVDIKKGGGARRADSTDAVATFLTRRFGIAGGLAWLGVLTFGVVSEQLKTRREVREAVENTKDVAIVQEVTTASGLRYTDLRVGGGEIPRPGYLLAANMIVTIEGTNEVVLDTRKTNRQVVFTFGRPQGPFTKGVMEAVGGMRQGGKRVVVVPPDLGFGSEEVRLQDGTVPAGATVRYDLELTRVSVPPS